jgi:hypothetical protein
MFPIHLIIDSKITQSFDHILASFSNDFLYSFFKIHCMCWDSSYGTCHYGILYLTTEAEDVKVVSNSASLS